MIKVGEGLVASRRRTVITGKLRIIHSVEDILALKQEADNSLILLVSVAGIAGLTPILPRIAGIICTSGGINSHVAIISREFGIPCLVSATIDQSRIMNGNTIALVLEDEKGEVYLYDE